MIWVHSLLYISLRVSKTVFHIQSHRTRPENLIDIQDYFTLKDVLISLTSTDRDLQQVNIMSLLPGPLTKSVECQNTQIICPLGMAAVETVPISWYEPSIFQCEVACTSDMYTFQSGNMTLDGHYNYHDVSMKSLVSNLDDLLCNVQLEQNAMVTLKLYQIIGVIKIMILLS